MPRRSLIALLLVAVVLGGCHRKGFDPRSFTSTDALFSAALAEFQKGRWDNAALGFERLTGDLPARDPRLPIAYFYLGRTQQEKDEHLTAAQTFQRIGESFPDDTLADDAVFEAARSYSKMWRRPELDAQHGQSALNLYRTLLVVHPDSPLRGQAETAVGRLEQMFATKDFDTGYHYMKRRAYDSAIIYFRDVVRLYPQAPKAREAYLRLLEAYRAINYREDVRETCVTMRARYPTDRDVTRECAGVG